MEQDKTAIDEARRQQQHGAVKSGIEGRVHADIRAQAQAKTQAEAELDEAKLHHVASRLRSKAIDDVVDTDVEIERQRQIARAAQFVDYLFYLIYGLLSLRFLLALIGANQGSGLVKLINGITSPFFAPFKGVLPNIEISPGFIFSSATLLAILIYALLHGAIKGLLRVVGRRRTEI